MRKKMLIFAVVIVVLIVALYFVTTLKDQQATENNDATNGTEEQDSADSSSDSLYQNPITPDELDKQLDEDDDAFVYYYQPDCSHCQRVSPILIPMAEEDFDIDMKELDLKEYNNKWDTYDIEGTPTLVYYQDGEEVDRISGAANTDEDIETEYKEFLEKHTDE